MRRLIIGLVLGIGLTAGVSNGQMPPPLPPMSTGNRQLDQMNRQMYQQQLYDYQFLQQQNQRNLDPFNPQQQMPSRSKGLYDAALAACQSRIMQESPWRNALAGPDSRERAEIDECAWQKLRGT